MAVNAEQVTNQIVAFVRGLTAAPEDHDRAGSRRRGGNHLGVRHLAG